MIFRGLFAPNRFMPSTFRSFEEIMKSLGKIISIKQFMFKGTGETNSSLRIAFSATSEVDPGYTVKVPPVMSAA